MKIQKNLKKIMEEYEKIERQTITKEQRQKLSASKICFKATTIWGHVLMLSFCVCEMGGWVFVCSCACMFVWRKECFSFEFCMFVS